MGMGAPRFAGRTEFVRRQRGLSNAVQVLRHVSITAGVLGLLGHAAGCARAGLQLVTHECRQGG